VNPGGGSGPRPGASRLLLVRHPETDWNRENRWQGHSDQPLNARGLEQMRTWDELVREEAVTAIYASDLRRAREPAEWIGGRLGIAPVVDPALRERSMGSWEGLTPNEARAAGPDVYARVEADPLRESPPGGEPFRALSRRTFPVLSRIAAAHPDETVLLVTHGGILKALLCRLLDLDLRERETLGGVNGTRVLVEVEGSRWSILKPADLAARQSSHLIDEALR
jgi:broad specificity phosphatase PhoE